VSTADQVPRRRAQAAVALTLGLCLAPLVGCGDDGGDAGNSAQSAEKVGTGELRTDLQPLTDRFEALGSPVSAEWMSGTFGDERLPGPSTYWIDAIVVLEQGVAAGLRDRYGPSATDERPAVVDELADRVPDDLTRSDELDAAFSESGFVTRAYLAEGDDVIVLASRGQ